MSKENSVGDSRVVYTPPCVVKISDLKQGAGSCATGSGDADGCKTYGNSARINAGCGYGNDASGYNCNPTGSQAEVNP